MSIVALVILVNLDIEAKDRKETITEVTKMKLCYFLTGKEKVYFTEFNADVTKDFD